ncbi:MAG: hypothetical protein ACRCTZ_05330 [Sarcina sp.]
MSKHKIEDRVLKEVGTLYSNGLIKLLNADFKIRRELSSEVTGVKSSRDMDMLLETDKEYLVNIEFQSSIENLENDLKRFRYYSASTMLAQGRDVKTYIVYSAKFKPKEIILKGEFGEFRPVPIFLYNISLNEELDRIATYEEKQLTEYDKIVLVLSTGLRYEGSRLELIKKAINYLNSSTDKETIGSLLLELSSKFLDKDEYKKVKEAITMVDIVRDIREEGIKEGMKEGLKEGLKEGVKEGKKEAVKAFLDVFDDEEIARRLNLDWRLVKKIREEVNN